MADVQGGNHRSLRTAWAASLGALLIAGLAPVVSSQAAVEALPRLAWTNDPIAHVAPGLPVCIIPGAEESPSYAMVPDPPGVDVPGGRAYGGLSTPYLSCPFFFVYRAEAAFTLRGSAHVQLWYACNAETPGPLAKFEFQLFRNGQPVGPQGAAAALPNEGECPGQPGAPVFATMALDDDLEFDAGDELALGIAFFYAAAPMAAGPSFYFATGGNATDELGKVVCCRSSIAIAGLPWEPVELYGMGSVPAVEPTVEPTTEPKGNTTGPTGPATEVEPKDAPAIMLPLLSAAILAATLRRRR